MWLHCLNNEQWRWMYGKMRLLLQDILKVYWSKQLSSGNSQVEEQSVLHTVNEVELVFWQQTKKEKPECLFDYRAYSQTGRTGCYLIYKHIVYHREYLSNVIIFYLIQNNHTWCLGWGSMDCLTRGYLRLLPWKIK